MGIHLEQTALSSLHSLLPPIPVVLEHDLPPFSLECCAWHLGARMRVALTGHNRSREAAHKLSTSARWASTSTTSATSPDACLAVLPTLKNMAAVEARQARSLAGRGRSGSGNKRTDAKGLPRSRSVANCKLIE
jgi:hypothetical protein